MKPKEKHILATFKHMLEQRVHLNTFALFGSRARGRRWTLFRMRQVKRIAVVLSVGMTLITPLAYSAQNDYEIDLNMLGPSKPKAKPQQQQVSPNSTGEIDLKELRRIAPPQSSKPAQQKHRSHVAAEPKITKATESGHESFYMVQPGEYLFQILMKRYGLSYPAAERLIPGVMQLNGISSPKGLKVGQRLRIPLPANEGRHGVSLTIPATAKFASETPAPTPIPVLIPVPVQDAAKTSTPNPVAPPAVPDTISIVSASPCKLARDLVEKMGLQGTSLTGIQGAETVSAVYAGRIITVACGLSEAEQYTYERLLARSGKLLLVFDEDESAEYVVEEMANSLGLEFHKSEAETMEQRLTYVFAPFGVRTQELQLTILPSQAPSTPPATN
jgi:hypothetical protein